MNLKDLQKLNSAQKAQVLSNLLNNSKQQMQNIEQTPLASHAQSLKIIFHLISSDQKNLESFLIDTQTSLSLQECTTILSQQLKKPMNNIIYRLGVQSEPLDRSKVIHELINKDKSQIFVFYQGLKAIIKQKEKELHFQTINKYSFLDQKQFVKVYIPLDNVGKIPDEQIQSRFLDRSVEVKIFGYQGKNWIFAIPKSQCQILTKQSKVLKKDNKLIIKIGKIAEADNWFSLHKTRCVGQKELD